MSTYINERSKVYLDLNPAALQEPQAYCLKILTENQAYLLDEIELCKQLAIKMKHFITITNIQA